MDKYLEIASILDEDALDVYNRYVVRYMQEDKETEMAQTNDENKSFLRRIPFFVLQMGELHLRLLQEMQQQSRMQENIMALTLPL